MAGRPKTAIQAKVQEGSFQHCMSQTVPTMMASHGSRLPLSFVLTPTVTKTRRFRSACISARTVPTAPIRREMSKENAYMSVLMSKFFSIFLWNDTPKPLETTRHRPNRFRRFTDTVTLLNSDDPIRALRSSGNLDSLESPPGRVPGQCLWRCDAMRASQNQRHGKHAPDAAGTEPDFFGTRCLGVQIGVLCSRHSRYALVKAGKPKDDRLSAFLERDTS